MLDDLTGRGWVAVDPPLEEDEASVVARYRGQPVRAGFTIEEQDGDDETYFKFRTGKYDLELKVDFLSGHAQMKVEEADGYNGQ